MKTIIHIGQHKTGTTSIQHFLQDNRETLIHHHLYVPSRIAGFSNPSHFLLNIYALEEYRYSPMKDEIIKSKGSEHLNRLKVELEIDVEKIYKEALQKNCNRILWSNEGLYLLNTPTEYKRLIGLFSEHSTEIEVICCFRDVKSYRDSYIKQLIKQRILFSDDPDSYRYIEPDSWLFDYERKKYLLSEIFDKCTFFSYDKNDNLKKFLETISINSTHTPNYKLNITASN